MNTENLKNLIRTRLKYAMSEDASAIKDIYEKLFKEVYREHEQHADEFNRQTESYIANMEEAFQFAAKINYLASKVYPKETDYLRKINIPQNLRKYLSGDSDKNSYQCEKDAKQLSEILEKELDILKKK